MSERPFMQLYVSDFVGDTLLLSAEQIGVYLLLLIALWNAGGELPDDDTKLSRVSRLTVHRWREVWIELAPFFEVKNGRITHGRLTKELQKSAGKSAARATAGKRGGEAKALKDKAAGLAIAVDLQQHLPETIAREKEIPAVSPKEPLSEDWNLPGEWLARTQASYPSVSLASILAEVPRFRDHYLANASEFAEWRNWCRNAFPNKEISPAGAKAAQEAMAARQRLHYDDPVFREIVRMRGKEPPRDREGCWTFPIEEIDQAKANLRTPA
jgi:uncharacterized protein YdaU (DUF1376 family)